MKMKMTRKEARNYLDRLNNVKLGDSVLFNAVVFFYDQLTHQTVCREILSTDDFEVRRWAATVRDEYIKLDFTFALYIDGRIFETHNGSVIDSLDLFSDEEEDK